MQLEILDWVDPGNAKGPELRATWARFRVLVEDWCPTRVISGEARGARDHVYVSVYPLAEWLVANWWFLNHEFKTPRSAYFERHSLGFAGDGSAYPNLSISPLGDVTEVSCQKRLLRHQRLEFIEDGRAFLKTEEVMRSIRRFVEYVLERLEDCGIRSTPLHEEWAAVLHSAENPEERDFCELVATLGEDPYDYSERTASSIERWSGKINRDTFQEVCAALSASTFEDGLKWIDRVSGELENVRSPWTKLVKLKKSAQVSSITSSTTAEPWVLGYADADKLRKQIGLNGQLFPRLDNLLDVFEPSGGVENSIRFDKGIPAFDGVVRTGSNGAPAFLIAKERDSSRKFAFVRSIYDYLQLKQGDLAVVTRSHSQLQQASRAFAAEFLAPSRLLKKEIAAEYVGWDEISDLAEKFGVAELVVEHQIVNHRLARIIDADASSNVIH